MFDVELREEQAVIGKTLLEPNFPKTSLALT